MKSEGLVSEECFVFADDSAGNPICMKIGGEDKESIFFCNHELENTNNGYFLMSKVADSFDEFIKKLYITGMKNNKSTKISICSFLLRLTSNANEMINVTNHIPIVFNIFS